MNRKNHWKTLKKISVNLCSQMLLLLFSRPHLIPFIIYATLETLYISDRLDEDHTAHNKANAYKHALWNILIAYHIQFFYSKPSTAVTWAKKITDMHEKCFKNKPAAEAMDLANNEIGRNIYFTCYLEFEKKPKKEILLNRLMAEQDSFIFLTD